VPHRVRQAQLLVHERQLHARLFQLAWTLLEKAKRRSFLHPRHGVLDSFRQRRKGRWEKSQRQSLHSRSEGREIGPGFAWKLMLCRGRRLRRKWGERCSFNLPRSYFLRWLQSVSKSHSDFYRKHNKKLELEAATGQHKSFLNPVDRPTLINLPKSCECLSGRIRPAAPRFKALRPIFSPTIIFSHNRRDRKRDPKPSTLYINPKRNRETLKRELKLHEIFMQNNR